MKKYVAEFIGTFFLVLVLVLVTNNGMGALAPLAIGGAMAAMAYTARLISGAHFNPAVSLALLLQGKLSRFDFPYYVVAQLLAAVMAALLAAFLLSSMGPSPEPRSHDALPALLAEFFGAFALIYVVLNVTAAQSVEDQSHYPLATGISLMTVTYALGGISGGVFNPAVAVGMAVSHLLGWEDLWMYLLGTLLAAAAATSVFQALKRIAVE